MNLLSGATIGHMVPLWVQRTLIIETTVWVGGFGYVGGGYYTVVQRLH